MRGAKPKSASKAVASTVSASTCHHSRKRCCSAGCASRAYLTGSKKKANNADLVISGPRFQGGLLGKGAAIAFRKDETALTNKLDTAIEAAKADGTIKTVSEKYFGFDVTPEWLDHVQKSSVRFNSGGSGSFVSADGLVMTNHHVGLGALQKLSSKEKDYVKDGFYAKTLDEEYKSVDEELNADDSVNGFLVQLPLPAQIDPARARPGYATFVV